MPTKQTSDPSRMTALAVRSRRALVLGASVASLGVLAVGCGSSTRPPAGSAGPSFKNFANAAYKYAACMRNHGVTGFPDPTVVNQSGHTQITQVVSKAFASAPQFKTAQQACRGIIPAPTNADATQIAAQQHAREEDLLSFAQCLRGHGLPGFPDPTSQGQLSAQMVTAAGIDLQAPATLTAAKACIGAAHGAITGADVERAINGVQ